MFFFPENIENRGNRLFAQLKKDKFLTGPEPEEFAEKEAHFLSELNVIYALREGSDRTQLPFFLLLADRARHPSSWRRPTRRSASRDDWLCRPAVDGAGGCQA